MKLEIIPRMTEIRCYVCGNKEIFGLCHHCQRAMCKQHVPLPTPKIQFYKQSEDSEFTSLGLADLGQVTTAIHCHDCQHNVVFYAPVFYFLGIIGVAIIVGSFVMPAFLSFISYFILGVSYLAVSVLGIYTEEEIRHHKMRQYRPAFPVFGRAAFIEAEESVKGTLEITSSGKYKAQLTSARGVLKFTLLFAFHDRDRLNKYQLKYQLSGLANIQFHAGFLTLRGGENSYIEIQDARQQSEIVPLGKKVVQQPFLMGSTTAQDTKWLDPHPYIFKVDKTFTSGLPIQIIPILISEQHALALDITVQTNPKLSLNNLFRPKVIKFAVEMPTQLGTIENITPTPETSNVEDSITVIWQNVPLLKRAKEAVQSGNFYIRYNSIDGNFEPQGTVKGNLTVSFSGAFSGLENVTWYTPLGSIHTTHITEDKCTYVEIDFVFNLKGLRVRRTYHDAQRIEKTIIPSYEMITRLVYAMSDKDIYVQRVIENPPHINRANAEIMNRLWVITGRRYKNALPIDFRIVAIGQEHYKDTDIPYSGHARFEITAQGTIVNNNARNDIRQLLDDICNLVQGTPNIDIWLTKNQLDVDKWGTIFGYIENKGSILVTNIHISASSNLIDIGRAASIEQLQPNNKEPFKLAIKANVAGEVPLTIMAICNDHYGQLPLYPHRCKLEVRRKSDY